MLYNIHLNLWHRHPLGDGGNGNLQLWDGVSQILHFTLHLAPFLKKRWSSKSSKAKANCDHHLMVDNVDLLLSLTSEGSVPEQQHHRVDVVSHPGSLDLEIPLKQAALPIFQHLVQVYKMDKAWFCIYCYDLEIENFHILSSLKAKKISSFLFYFFWRSIPNDDWLELELKGLHPLLVLIIQSSSQVPTILNIVITPPNVENSPFPVFWKSLSPPSPSAPRTVPLWTCYSPLWKALLHQLLSSIKIIRNWNCQVFFSNWKEKISLYNTSTTPHLQHSQIV